MQMGPFSQKPLVTLSLFFLLAMAISAQAHAQTQTLATQTIPALQPLITQQVDEAQLTVLKGNVHPLARPQYDLGTAPATLPMERMLLVLKRSPEQESALRKLLDDQQDKHSPSYHKWLTPEQFGKQFGPTDSDMQAISGWLLAHGFQLGAPSKGRTLLEFSGSASQVQEAFHTSIHKYVVNGEQHWANASDLQIPTALTPAVAGVFSMHNFLSKPHLHLSPHPVEVKFNHGKPPYVTFPPQNGQPAINALGPQDYATIYNINPVYNNPTNGQGRGITIGVIGRNDLYSVGGLYTALDVNEFFSAFGMAMPFVNIDINGPDPGDAGGGEEAEATLDTTWSAAIAPQATIDFVVSGSTNTTDGIDLSELYIIENNLTDIMTESFGSCEYFNTDTRIAATNALAEQAAAQGITYFVSTGDSGAEGCDDPNSETVATGPVSINMLASTPFTTAVGGTMFNENGQTSLYWASTAFPASTALSYIPENVWNESCQTATCASIWAGSGGASAGNIANTSLPGTTPGIPKPSWQTALTPQDGVRDIPDLSLTAAGHDPYLLCIEASCENGFIYFISGTSAAAPSFAGIMALIDSQMAVMNPGQSPRQGQANYILYQLAALQNKNGWSCNGSSSTLPDVTHCIFNDTTVGNNSVPGESGYPNGLYSAGTGYDRTTGLGSVNVANLVANWNSVTFNPTTTTLTLNNNVAVNITHGQSVPLDVTVAPSSGTGTPTGRVVLYTSAFTQPNTIGPFNLSGGQVLSSTSELTGNGGGTSYNVWAHYSGDTTYAPSDSSMVSVIVNSEGSTTTETAFASDLNGNPLPLTNIPFGSLVFVRADVRGLSGQGTPTGQVTFIDTAGPLPTSNPQTHPPVNIANPSPLNSQGNTSIGDGIVNFDAGSHTISATYSGDFTFLNSASSQPVTFSILPGFSIVTGPASASISTPGGTTSVSVGIVASTGFSTMSFSCSGLPSEATCASATATPAGPTNVVNTTINITTTAPHTTSLYRPKNIYFAQWMASGGFAVAGIFVLGFPRTRRKAFPLLLILVAATILLPSCGGGSKSTPAQTQDPGTPAGTYTVTITATGGSITQSGSFSLVVQ